MLTGKLMVFNGPDRPFEFRTKDIRPLAAGEILVRNLFTTICGSDLHTYGGLRKEACPTVLGHEIVGRIEELGPSHAEVDYKNEKIGIGDIVTWSIFSSDPDSLYSREGIPQKGEGLFKYGHELVTEHEGFHGGLAEYCILRRGTGVLKILPEMPLPVAAIMNCSLATVAGAMRLAGDLRGKNVLIFGAGMLGITASAMSKELGAAWVGIADVSAKRLSAAFKFGTNEIFDLSANGSLSLKERCSRFMKNGVDVVFDMSGSPDAMESGVSLLAIGGSAIWVGAVFATRKIQLDAEWIVRHLISIRGLHNYNYEDFVSAHDFITGNWKKYPFESVVEKEFDLAHTQEAFAYAVTNKPLRVGIRI